MGISYIEFGFENIKIMILHFILTLEQISLKDKIKKQCMEFHNFNNINMSEICHLEIKK